VNFLLAAYFLFLSVVLVTSVCVGLPKEPAIALHAAGAYFLLALEVAGIRVWLEKRRQLKKSGAYETLQEVSDEE
jgi:hypothetical protein